MSSHYVYIIVQYISQKRLSIILLNILYFWSFTLLDKLLTFEKYFVVLKIYNYGKLKKLKSRKLKTNKIRKLRPVMILNL